MSPSPSADPPPPEADSARKDRVRPPEAPPGAPAEFAFIDWLRGRTPADPRVLVGPGDDAAVVGWPAGPALVTTDMLLEGSCFVLAEAGPRRVGRKAMA